MIWPRRVHSFYFIRTRFQPESCKPVKNMLRIYPRLGEEQSVFFTTLTFLNIIKSELHIVLHGIRVRVKFCSFALLCMVNNTFTLDLHNSLNMKTI